MLNTWDGAGYNREGVPWGARRVDNRPPAKFRHVRPAGGYRAAPGAALGTHERRHGAGSFANAHDAQPKKVQRGEILLVDS